MNTRRIKRVLRGGDYIPVAQTSIDFFTKYDRPYWTPVRRVPLDSIKVDRSRMSFANEVSDEQVKTIIEHFDLFAWLPVTLDKDFYLLDGQHRLAVARLIGLKYLDVVIQDTELLNTPRSKQSRPAWAFL